MDKPGANADKIREQLSTMNILVEDWGGKIQSQDISAKKGDTGSILEIGEPEGDYEGQVENRKWNIIIHADREPVSVWYNEKPFPEERYSWDESKNELTIKGIVAPATIEVKK